MEQPIKRPYHFSDSGRLAHAQGCAKGGRNAVGKVKAPTREQAQAAANVRWARHRQQPIEGQT